MAHWVGMLAAKQLLGKNKAPHWNFKMGLFQNAIIRTGLVQNAYSNN